MSTYEVKDVVCDYGIYENGELKLILNSRGSALKIKRILDFDDSLRNEARPYNDTNFDKITQNVDSFIKWVLDNYNSVPPALNCETSCNKDCGECFKKWLLQDAE